MEMLNKPLEPCVRINPLGELLQFIDLDSIPGIPVRKILKELLLADAGYIPEMLPQEIGMPFYDLSHAEAGDDLLLRGVVVNEHRFYRLVLENLFAELVLFCSDQDLFYVFWLNGKQNAGQFRTPPALH
jgi:hypothetical protein